MKRRVIGQTGSMVISDEGIAYDRSRARTVRYQYRKIVQSDKNGKVIGTCWIAWVCGPFHSRTYGVQGYGASRKRAKAALQRRLSNDYGYLGHLLFSDVDESDTVGVVDMRLLDKNEKARPVTVAEVW